MRVLQHEADGLADYHDVPSTVEVLERAVFDGLAWVGSSPVTPWIKDYDAYPDDKVEMLAATHDTSAWCLLRLESDSSRIGGCVAVPRDLHSADVIDLRVASEWRGLGGGRMLVRSVEAWARRIGLAEIRIETQDVNVPACHFYRALGYQICEVTPDAYPDMDETRIIWSKLL